MNNLTPRLALYRGTGFVSWLIKTQTRSVYSHAALLIPGTTDRVLESREGKGVQLHTLTDKEQSIIDWYAIPSMTDEQYNRTIEIGLSQLGMPYDYWSVLRFVSKRPARENGKWFCSECAHKWLAEGGVRLLERIPSAEIPPGGLSYSPLAVPVPAP